MKQIKAPFTKDQVDNLNAYQHSSSFHPFTCANQGDKAHIKYEFEKLQSDKNYKEYLKSEKEKGINYPEIMFTNTNLIATEDGWICPACDYKQNWAHDFMADKNQILDDGSDDDIIAWWMNLDEDVKNNLYEKYGMHKGDKNYITLAGITFSDVEQIYTKYNNDKI